MRLSIFNTLSLGLRGSLLLAASLLALGAGACMDVPKALTLSGASFDGKIDLEVKSNCQATINVDDARWVRRLSRNSDSGQVCLHVRSVNYDYNIERKYCDQELENFEQQPLQDDLILRDKEGQAVGELRFKNGKMRILSLVENEINLSKPFIEVTTKSDQLFLVSAFEGQGKKIGHFPIESRGCTRAFGDTGFGTVDLRGKKIRLGTGACKSRLEVANW